MEAVQEEFTAIDIDALQNASSREEENFYSYQDYAQPEYEDSEEGEWYIVKLNTIVREGESLESDRLCVLQIGNHVHAIEKRGRRCRIDVPVRGWCSLRSKQGDIILGLVDHPPNGNDIQIPDSTPEPLAPPDSILLKTVSEQQTTILKLQQQIKELQIINQSLLHRETKALMQNENEDNEEKCEKPISFPQALTVSGVEGHMAHKLNGIYQRTDIEYGGRNVWERKDGDTDVVLWFWEEKKYWLFSRKEHLGTEHSYALAKDFPQADFKHRFLVYEPDEKQHIKQIIQISFPTRNVL